MKKFAFALAAAASFASAPAQATHFLGYGDIHNGCGSSDRCHSPLRGDLTYDGDGGTIRDATWSREKVRKDWVWTETSSVFTSSIKVVESFSIADVNVSLNEFEHNNWSDLQISLSHGGNVVWLVQNKGSDKDADGNYVFDDAATNLIGGKGKNWLAGTYKPTGSLSDFNGLDSAGLWTLNIYDTNADNRPKLGEGKKVGELCDWTLQLTPTPTSAVPEPATWAMMIAGFGMVGVQMRRRRSTGLAMVRA